jgi:hypothetical protein
MRSLDHMPKHLCQITRIDGKETYRQQIADPFATTKVIIGWNLWDWLRMLFSRPREIEVVVEIQGDGVATNRWFAGRDVCERCQRTAIGFPLDGSSAADPGYHHGEERLCERCYYGLPDEPGQAFSCFADEKPEA